MKKYNYFGIIALIAVIGFSFAACENGDLGGGSVLPAPTGLTVTNVSSTDIWLAWNPVPGAAGYSVYGRSSASSNFVLLDSGMAATPTFHAYNCQPDTTYFFRVAAYAANGTEGSIATISAKTLPGSGPGPDPVDPPNPPGPTPTTGTFVITGSGTSFTATRSSVLVPGATGTIAAVITAIRTNAAGADCEIQFGSGADTLNIGTVSAAFDNTGGTWGVVTLKGKVTSANGTATITIDGAVSITTQADIGNTAGNGSAIFTKSSGALNISGGNVITTGSTAVNNNYNAALNISGGMITSSRLQGPTVLNNAGGTVTITNGTVASTGNQSVAVRNNSVGTVNIQGGTITTSAGSGSYGEAVVNGSAGTVNISGGIISATGEGKGVYNTGAGSVNISGGTVLAKNNPAVYIGGSSSGTVTISGTALVTSETTGRTIGFISGSSATLLITGGTVSNTTLTNNGNAIGLPSTSPNLTVNITGGRIYTSAPNGKAVNADTFFKGSITIRNPPAVDIDKTKCTSNITWVD